MRRLLAIVVWLAFMAASRMAWAAPPKEKHREHRVAPFPVFKSEPGVGLTLGGRGRYVWRKETDRLNRITLDGVARVSLTKVQNYEFRLRMRDLLGRNEVFDFNIELQDDPIFTYVGIANQKRLSNDGIMDDRYELHRFSVGPDFNYQHLLREVQPSGWMPFPGYLRGFVGWKFEYDNLRAEHEQSLFEAQRPQDVGRSRRGSYYLGLAWDSRDNDTSPKYGGFHDISVAAAGPWAGGTRTWGRANASFRQYRRLGIDQLILAGQVLAEYQWGDVPLVAQGEFSGLVYREGLGGAYTARGYFRRRFVGDFKSAANAELRVEPYELKIWRWTVTPAFKPFVDLAYVSDRDGEGDERLHVSWGAGIYFIWDRFEILRFDGAFSPEGFAMLISADHAF